MLNRCPGDPTDPKWPATWGKGMEKGWETMGFWWFLMDFGINFQTDLNVGFQNLTECWCWMAIIVLISHHMFDGWNPPYQFLAHFFRGKEIVFRRFGMVGIGQWTWRCEVYHQGSCSDLPHCRLLAWHPSWISWEWWAVKNTTGQRTAALGLENAQEQHNWHEYVTYIYNYVYPHTPLFLLIFFFKIKFQTKWDILTAGSVIFWPLRWWVWPSVFPGEVWCLEIGCEQWKTMFLWKGLWIFSTFLRKINLDVQVVQVYFFRDFLDCTLRSMKLLLKELSWFWVGIATW